MKITYMKIDDIKPYPDNPRDNTETVKSLVKLIKKVGFNVPVVVDKNNVIVKGNARWKAAKELGLKEIPCYVSENDDETNNIDRIADNKVSELAQWDEQLLQYELASIESDLREVGLEFNITPSEIREITKQDIENAEEWIRPDIEEDVDAFISVECPNCGGHFEYKPTVK